MLKIIVLWSISAILTNWLLGLKFVAYDPEDKSAINGIFAAYDLIKDFIVIFMLLWYVLK